MCMTQELGFDVPPSIAHVQHYPRQLADRAEWSYRSIHVLRFDLVVGSEAGAWARGQSIVVFDLSTHAQLPPHL